MVDLSMEEVAFNIDTTAKYLERAAPMKLWIEMEIGVTGGEEDGVNNGDSTHSHLLQASCQTILLLLRSLFFCSESSRLLKKH